MAEELKLEKELTVEVPLDRVWHALSDLDTFASCLPGAELRLADGTYTGRVTLGSDGGVVCETAVRSVDLDDDEHVATILLHARQVDGPAIGSVTVRGRCEGADSSTRVQLSAAVIASGHEHVGEPFERAARELFDQVSERLQQRAASTPPPPAPEPAPGAAAPVRQPEATPAVAQRTPETTLALAAAAIIIIALVRWLLGRRRGGLW